MLQITKVCFLESLPFLKSFLLVLTMTTTDDRITAKVLRCCLEIECNVAP